MSEDLNKRVVVIGGGCIGMIAALGFERKGFSVQLIEKKVQAQEEKGDCPCRLFAICKSSCDIILDLCQINVLELGQEISRISIAERDAVGDLLFDPAEIELISFGVMVDERKLLEALKSKIAQTNISLIEGFVEDLSPDGTITISGSGEVRADLVIVADGKHSYLRDCLGIEHVERDYRHTAIIADIEHSKDHQGVAFENFTEQGSFGVLPNLGLADTFRSSIVWSLEDRLADSLISMTSDKQAALIADRVPESLGEVKLCSKLIGYRLKLVYAREYNAGRCYLAGDTLHAIHPLAGQGMNIGIRDIRFLVESSQKAYSIGLDIGINPIIGGYFKNRYTDNQLMIESTHTIHKLFASNSPIFRIIRRASKDFLSINTHMRRLVMSYAAGVLL